MSELSVVEVRRRRASPAAPPASRRVVRRGRVIAEALFARDEGPAPADRLDWLERDLADFLARSGAWARFLFGLCSFVVCAIGPLLRGRLRAMAALSVAERQAVFTRIEHGPLSPTLLACKAVLCIIYFEHPDTLAEMAMGRGGAEGGEPS